MYVPPVWVPPIWTVTGTGYLRGMVCVVCGWWKGRAPEQLCNPRASGVDVLCPTCSRSLRGIGEVRLGSGLLVRSLFVHEGAIRSAVHALKYRGVDRIAAVLAPGLAGLLPADTSALVPVPRALARRVRYGVDAGRVLARAIAESAGLPVADVLRAPLRHRSQLRVRRAEGLRFRLVEQAPRRAVLIDDVLTTGATISAAAAACRGAVSWAVTLTRSPIRGCADREMANALFSSEATLRMKKTLVVNAKLSTINLGVSPSPSLSAHPLTVTGVDGHNPKERSTTNHRPGA